MIRNDGAVNQAGLHEKWDPVGRTDGQFIYHGVAAPGITASQKGWMIEKNTFTTVGSNDIVTDKAVVFNAIWDDRAATTTNYI